MDEDDKMAIKAIALAWAVALAFVAGIILIAAGWVLLFRMILGGG